jgi:hypothetical protein
MALVRAYPVARTVEPHDARYDAFITTWMAVARCFVFGFAMTYRAWGIL